MERFKSKITYLIVCICLFFLADFCALLKIQVLDSNRYYVLSEKNRIRIYPIFPKRGEIYDRYDRKIASNVPTYRLMIVRSNKKQVIQTLNSLKKIINIDMTDNELNYKLKNFLSHSYITVKDALSWDEYAKLALYLDNMDNLVFGYVYNRQYTEPYAISHVVGYVGTNPKNEACIDGKSGLEFSRNDTLSGVLGNRKIEVNSRMKFVRELDIVHPINGENLKITIDIKLQEFVYKILSQHESAACVVLDLQNGHVLSAVSVPGFDTNMFSKKISLQDWSNIINNKYKPMNNRIFRSVYSPGSIFKLFIAYAALDLKKISPSEKIRCNGHTMLGTGKFHCWNRGGHGPVNMSQAITYSCDVYFHEVARRLGIDNISEYAHKFGFGEYICDDICNESVGLVPNKKWKMSKRNIPWQEYETLLVGTGQGDLLANIMQIATAVARLCSGNSNFVPTLIFNKNGNDGKTNLNTDITDSLKQAMYNVCNAPRGTARKACHTNYGIAGKTGSTQVRRMKDGEHGISQKLLKWESRDHALFAGFAPYNSPRYVVAVVVEHGGGGGSVAAPIARQIFDWLVNEYH